MSSVESAIVAALAFRFLSLFYFEKLKKIEYLENGMVPYEKALGAYDETDWTAPSRQS